MRLTAKGRYGMYAMYNLSRCCRKEPTPIWVLAKDQDLSVNFLEQLFVRLRSQGIVKSVRGARGGYLLSRDPKEITVGEILRAVGEDILPVCCRPEQVSGENASPQDNTDTTNLLWLALQDHVNQFLDSTTLHDLDGFRSR